MFEFTVSAWIVALVVTYLQPAAVGLLTKVGASVRVKQAVAAVVAYVAAALTGGIQTDGTAVFYISKETVTLALLMFLGGQAGYTALYKPYDANAKKVMLPTLGVG